MFKIVYETYGNPDFKNIVFALDKEHRDALVNGLRSLRHVTRVATGGKRGSKTRRAKT